MERIEFCFCPKGVGVRLLAIAMGQLNIRWLTHCVRGQARSYR